MKAEDLKKGSIVRMTYSTYANQFNEDWSITRRYLVVDSEFIEYVADCVVCNVTAKFFQVIIPHLNDVSVKYSKRCFTDTKYSYADKGNFKAHIVSI